jgi:hypothetical protein
MFSVGTAGGVALSVVSCADETVRLTPSGVVLGCEVVFGGRTAESNPPCTSALSEARFNFRRRLRECVLFDPRPGGTSGLVGRGFLKMELEFKVINASTAIVLEPTELKVTA